jgi:glycosyltransferase involved in cell wall biosynthesis
MKILKVWDGEYPWDVRTEKVCRALTEGGHEVHMVARNRDGRVLREELPECTVHRMSPWRALGSSLDAASQFPAFFNPRWIRFMAQVGAEVEANLLLVRDLPLAPTAIHVARKLGVPVILDMAENYPAMIRDLWTTGSTKPGDFLIRNPRAVEAVERWVVANVDHVVVVVEESGARLVRDLGVDPTRITVVGNTPASRRLEDFPPPRRVSDFEEIGGDSEAPALHMVYLGLLEEARGIGTAIEAVGRARARGVPVRFTVIGDGRAREAFHAKVERLELEPWVRLLGYLPYEEALGIVAQADIGIIPHLANESWNTTIPNKLFDYMAAGLAVLTSDAAPARRVVEETGSGHTFTSGDAESLTSALVALWEGGGHRACGERGREAIRQRYNWETDAERLLETVETVGASRKSEVPAHD